MMQADIDKLNAEYAGKYAAYAYHGGPFDRGGADYYYGRRRHPHKYPNGTYNGPEVTDLTPEEIAAYHAGYDQAAAFGDRKDWGVEDVYDHSFPAGEDDS
jgi:hypothetical protein